jgi:nucleotide-binding universal stress UspA family protein
MRHMYGKILVAIDGSETSIKALDHAVELAKVHGSSINLIAVIEELKLPFGAQYSLWANESHQELMRTSLESLNKEMMRVKDSNPGIEVDAIVHEGDPASIIVRVADEEGYDLIVMGRKGMGIIEGLVMGSVTRKVVKTSNVTVTVVT